MNWNAFFDELKRKNIAALYVFDGAEERVKAEALAALRALILPPGLEMLNETVLESPSAETVIEAAETMPMMSDKRLVVARDFPALMPGQSANAENELKRLSDYVKAPCGTSVIVIYLRGEGEKTKKPAKAFRETAACVEFGQLSESEAAAWISKTLKPLGKKMSVSAARMLMSTAGRDLTRLGAELSKLAAYSGARAEIDEADIEAVVAQSVESNIFKMTDALISGNTAGALSILNAMIDSGEQRFGIIAAITRQVRGMAAMKRAAEDKKTKADVQKLLGLQQYPADKMARQSQAFTIAQLDELYELCLYYDQAFKSGLARDSAALDAIILRISGICAKK